MKTLVCQQRHIITWDADALDREAPKFCGECGLPALEGKCRACGSPVWRDERHPDTLDKCCRGCGKPLTFVGVVPTGPREAVGGENEAVKRHAAGQLPIPPRRTP